MDYYTKNHLYIHLSRFRPKAREMEGHLLCANQEYPLHYASMFLSTLLGYSRVCPSSLSNLRLKPKDSIPRGRIRYRLKAERWSPGGG